MTPTYWVEAILVEVLGSLVRSLDTVLKARPESSTSFSRLRLNDREMQRRVLRVGDGPLCEPKGSGIGQFFIYHCPERLILPAMAADNGVPTPLGSDALVFFAGWAVGASVGLCRSGRDVLL